VVVMGARESISMARARIALACSSLKRLAMSSLMSQSG